MEPITPALERATQTYYEADPIRIGHPATGIAIPYAGLTGELRATWHRTTGDILAAALYAPTDTPDMDPLTLAVHRAICEQSPDECMSEYSGDCVRATRATRNHILGAPE